MTALAGHIPVHTLQGKRSPRVRAQSNLLRQPEPTNAGVTILASISELRLVHSSVAGNAVRADTGGFHISLVVAVLALRLRVTPREAQARMVLPYVGDFAPVGFVVAGDAFRSTKRAMVGILVTRHALGLQSEKRGVSAPVATVVTILASSRRMGTLERPTRLAMIEPVACTARPPDEPRTPSAMLDVTRPHSSPRYSRPCRPACFRICAARSSWHPRQASCRAACRSSGTRCSSRRHRCRRGRW